jgi:tetratricopeptide (TPR) repeat protein
MEEALPQARRVGHHGAVWVLMSFPALMSAARGDLAAAAAELMQANQYGHARDLPWAVYSDDLLGVIALYQGRGGEGLQHIRRAVEAEPASFMHGRCRAALFWALAHERDAAALRFLRQNPPPLPVPGRSNRLGAWFSLPHVVEGLAWLGERDEVASLHPAMEALAETGVQVLNFSLIRICAGIAAAAVRDWPRAEAHYQTAMQQAASAPFRWAEPQARAWYAEMLLDRDGAGDRDRARALLEEALEMYAALGVPGFERRARERLVSLG